MLAESIHALARYNLWASEQMAARLRTLTEEQFRRPVQSSFPTIRDTVVHLHLADNIWLQRLKNVHRPQAYAAAENSTGETETANWLENGRMLAQLIERMDDEALVYTITYPNLKGEPHNNFRWQMIQHCVNHGSYHRGQLVTMMREVGVTAIPNTDMIRFYRMSATTVR